MRLRTLEIRRNVAEKNCVWSVSVERMPASTILAAILDGKRSFAAEENSNGGPGGRGWNDRNRNGGLIYAYMPPSNAGALSGDITISLHDTSPFSRRAFCWCNHTHSRRQSKQQTTCGEIFAILNNQELVSVPIPPFCLSSKTRVASARFYLPPLRAAPVLRELF